MKTLSEEINEIKNAKISKTAKRTALAKLGLLKSDVEIVMSSMPAPEARGSRFAYTFGVEIECYNVDRDLMHQSADANALRIAYEGYNHRDNTEYYKFVRDGSIVGDNGIECVSPVLDSRTGFASLEACCKALNETGAKVNRTTGLHVHIATRNMTGEWYRNVFQNYKMLEGVIDTFMAPSRRADNNYYCDTLQDHDFWGCTTINDVQMQLNGSRYHKVNAEAYKVHKTIEFRQHQGTTDFEKISHWVRFCAKLVGWSKRFAFDSTVASIDEIPFLTKTEKNWFKRRAAVLSL